MELTIVHLTCLAAVLAKVQTGTLGGFPDPPATTPLGKAQLRQRADGGAPAGTRVAVTARQEVEAALAKGPNPTELQRLAASAEPTLIAIADDRADAELTRGRALSALAYARSGRAHAFLENFIIKKTPSREPSDRVLVRRAAMSLGWQSGPRLTEVLAPLLDSDDRDVRLDAAAALALGHPHDAERPLRARLAVETDPAVKKQIEAALRAVPAP